VAAESPAPEKVRIDRWLWAARAFKTRSLAGKACTAGHVRVNGDGVKPARLVGPGDEVEIESPRGTRVLVIQALGTKRGPAAWAQTLYEEREVRPPERDEFGLSKVRPLPRGPRPSVRDRRRLRRMRGK